VIQTIPDKEGDAAVSPRVPQPPRAKAEKKGINPKLKINQNKEKKRGERGVRRGGAGDLPD